MCPGVLRLDHGCVVTVALTPAASVQDMFQKAQLRALAQSAAFVAQDSHLVMQIQGHAQGSPAGGGGLPLAEFAKSYLVSLGADADRISTIASEGETPAVVLVMWNNEAEKN